MNRYTIIDRLYNAVLHNENLTMSQACDLLNQDGIKRPRGGDWTPPTLAQALWGMGTNLSSLKSGQLPPYYTNPVAREDALENFNEDPTDKTEVLRARVMAVFNCWLTAIKHPECERVYAKARERWIVWHNKNVEDRKKSLITFDDAARVLNANQVFSPRELKWNASNLTHWCERNGITLEVPHALEESKANEHVMTNHPNEFWFYCRLRLMDFTHIPIEPYDPLTRAHARA
jgi:hypothetical protein